MHIILMHKILVSISLTMIDSMAFSSKCNILSVNAIVTIQVTVIVSLKNTVFHAAFPSEPG